MIIIVAKEKEEREIEKTITDIKAEIEAIDELREEYVEDLNELREEYVEDLNELRDKYYDKLVTALENLKEKLNDEEID